VTVNFFEALNMLGVPTEFDPQGGTTAGAAFCPGDINPKNQTRCDARRAYYDPYVGRQNFHVITGQHVTRVLVEHVKSNAQAGIPSPGGFDGTGNASTSNWPAFDSSQPTVSGASSKTRKRQLTPALRISGVEVRDCVFIFAIQADKRHSLLPTLLLPGKQSMRPERSFLLLVLSIHLSY
jgi:hypothetical protein